MIIVALSRKLSGILFLVLHQLFLQLEFLCLSFDEMLLEGLLLLYDLLQLLA